MISVFRLVDLDDSGELEPEEILDVFMDRKQLGQSRDEQAKQDAMVAFWKNLNSLKAYVYEILDLDWTTWDTLFKNFQQFTLN